MKIKSTIIKEQKKPILYFIIIMLLFGTGIGLGYYLWGVDRQKKPDYKKYLSKTINYIVRIEENNKDLTAQIKGLKADITAMKKEIKDAQTRFDGQSKNLEQVKASLDKEKALLNSSVSDNQNIKNEKKQLLAKIDTLTNEKNELHLKINGFINEKDQLWTKVDELTNEKDQLRINIDQLTAELNTIKQKNVADKPSPGIEEKVPALKTVEPSVGEEKEQ